MEHKLLYNKPSSEWMEGLPIGNGRLAAMLCCDEDADILHLNHEWLWRGLNRDRDNIPSADKLSEVRALLKKGDFFNATSLANTHFAGQGGIAKTPNRVDAYQPAGDLRFRLNGVSKFKSRQLDIMSGVANIEREMTNGFVESESLAHSVHNNIIFRWSGDTKFSGVLSYTRLEDINATEKHTISKDTIIYECKFIGGLSFKVMINIKTDGETRIIKKDLEIDNASEIIAFVNIATEVSGIETELEKYAAPYNFSWHSLLDSHKNKFSQVMSRFKLEIPLIAKDMPTDERIHAIKSGEIDEMLPLLYFNFGRYLLVSSSICGELPANLQGKWNDKLNPPWDSDYHFDINLQMNYWMAEAANMSECVEALIRYIERFLPHAKKAAQDLYGCRGVYLPLQTDAWGISTPESCGYAVWIGAAPWIAQHFWWHYEYNGDVKFLKDRAYPFFKEIARFYEDYLEEDENGIMQIMPSQSPENCFHGTGRFPVSICKSSAMDVQLAYDALGYAIQAAKHLCIDEQEVMKWEELRSKLPDFKIGKDRRLLEWDEERAEVNPGHRHLSHLYGLYPSRLFNPYERSEQYEAAIKSLDCRLKNGGGHTGWSRAWVACLYARIGQGEKVWEHVNSLITEFATTSLLDLHPPGIFQIDGNLGAVAAIIESIAQYWGGKLHLLRALPNAWQSGGIKGLKVPGGHSISFEWKNGTILSMVVVIGYSKELIISNINGQDLTIKGSVGETIEFIQTKDTNYFI